MRLFPLLLCVIAVTVFAAPADTSSASKPRLGMNVGGAADYSTDFPFVDIFKSSRPWISQEEGKGWGNGPALELDEQGWIKRLSDQGDCYADSPMNTDLNGHCPLGIYTILYDGEGKLEVALGDAKVVSAEPGRMQVEVGGNGAFFLRLRETNPNNYIRNIRVIMPGFEDTYAKEPFHPVYLNRWKGTACLRFMDAMRTNGSTQVKWADRTKVNDASYAQKSGVPIEILIDMANRLKIDPWFCIPHMANNDYVENFAKLVKEKLDPSLKPHIEYSNEMWNGSFPQTQWAYRMAKEGGIGPADRPWEGGAQIYVERSLEIFKIWEKVFGGKDRLVSILAWQAGSDSFWLDGQLLARTKGAEDVDAIAIAPYISVNVPAESQPPAPNAAEVSQWTEEQVMDFMENEALPQSIKWIEGCKAVADKYGVKMMAYEGGQHMVGIGGGENNAAMTALFVKANGAQRMGEIYKKYYDAWTAAGGDLHCHYYSIGKWGRYGSWGLAEYYDTKPSDVPKYQATLDWAKSQGQAVTMDPWAGIAAPTTP
ncbi:MAG: hypothetical protein NTV93_12925 [Verrucomicrobia bacterium]|nr:hypothetical protein [Verrucomicrobiota bacterium]